MTNTTLDRETEVWTYRGFECRIETIKSLFVSAYVLVGDEWVRVVDGEPEVTVDTADVEDIVDDIVENAVETFEDSGNDDDDLPRRPDFPNPFPQPTPSPDPPQPFPDPDPKFGNGTDDDDDDDWVRLL